MKPPEPTTLTYHVLQLGNLKEQLLNEVNWGGAQKKVSSIQDTQRALDVLAGSKPQLVLIDLDHPDFQQPDFLNEIVDAHHSTFVGITTTRSLALVVKAIKIGLHEVINPEEDPIRLGKIISKLVQQWLQANNGEQLYQKRKEKFDFSSIIGESLEMKTIFELVSKIVRQKWVTVLIQGETGTGKDLIARSIHYNSFDEFNSFVEISCNALPENLLESELFGYEKGAFTDAKSRKRGLFELAQNGTLFLDEIGELSLTTQAKLLRALEHKRIRRLGGTEDIRIEARLISATNRDLRSAIEKRLFRNDLYYRLNVIAIKLPPLRERGNDVVLLANHFLQHYLAEYNTSLRGFSADAETLLKSYHWPGNVRELKHTIERMVLLGEGEMITRDRLVEIIDSDSPLMQRESPAMSALELSKEAMSLADQEKLFIKATLDRMKWNKRQTCKVLKISRSRLDRKIQKYNLHRNE